MTTYYVNKDHGLASDGNDGDSPSLPWATIGKANTFLTAGHKVIVVGQGYNEVIQPANGGDANAPITYQAHPSAGCLIDRGGVGSIVDTPKNYIYVDGFEGTDVGADAVISGGIGCFFNDLKIHDTNGVNTFMLNGATNPRVFNCEAWNILAATAVVRFTNTTGLWGRGNNFYKIDGDGWNTGNATNTLIERNLVHTFVVGSGGHQDAFAIENANNYVCRYNKVFDFTQLFYVSSQGSQATVHDLMVYGNLFFCWQYAQPNFGDTDGSGGIFIADTLGGVLLTGAQEFYNNTFGFTGGVGPLKIYSAAGSVTPVAQNNLFHKCRGDSPGTSANIEILIDGVGAYDNTDYNLYDGPATVGPDANAVTGDPKLRGYIFDDVTADPLGFDFHCLSGGAGINAGNPNLHNIVTMPSEGLLDLDGNIRPQGAAYDIGAYELSLAMPGSRRDMQYPVDYLQTNFEG